MTDQKLNYVQHRDDEGIDEIQMLVDGEPFIRCRMQPRYKTSGLSGDEWRVSAIWEKREGGLWVAFDGPYHKLSYGAAAAYPGVFSSHKDWHELNCTAARLLRKGVHAIDMSNNGKPLPLLAALGHLPWALEVWPFEEHGLRAPFGGECTKDLCFQVGCREPAISTYGLKSRYDRQGHEHPAVRPWDGSRDAVRFCAKHLRRGDCGLEDADRNYIVIDGPGPDGHATDPGDVSPSRVAAI